MHLEVRILNTPEMEGVSNRTLVCEAEKDPQRSCGLSTAQPEGQSGT